MMMAMMVECMAGATSVAVGATAPFLCRTRMSSFAFPDAFLARIPSVGRGRGSWSKVSCGLSPHSLRVIAKGLGNMLRRKSEFINVLVSFCGPFDGSFTCCEKLIRELGHHQWG